MLRVLITMIVACVSAALAQVLMRRGMLQLGSLETWAPLEVLAYFWHALCNPWVIAGTVLSAVFYFLFLAVLSWAEVSLALPLTALQYIIVAVLGILVLGETVPPLRWAGILLVVAGVALMGLSGGADGRPRAEPLSAQSPSHELAPR